MESERTQKQETRNKKRADAGCMKLAFTQEAL